jgi:hypothetical protein
VPLMAAVASAALEYAIVSQAREGGWQAKYIPASGVGTATIQRIEKSHRPITGYVSTLVRIQAAFEQAGIQFIADDEMGGVGLRMAKKKRSGDRSLVSTKSASSRARASTRLAEHAGQREKFTQQFGVPLRRLRYPCCFTREPCIYLPPRIANIGYALQLT